jgi:hypothetical protein
MPGSRAKGGDVRKHSRSARLVMLACSVLLIASFAAVSATGSRNALTDLAGRLLSASSAKTTSGANAGAGTRSSEATAAADTGPLTGPACPDVMFIAARGSGEKPQGDKWVKASAYTTNADLGAGAELYDLYQRLQKAAPKLKFAMDPVMYPAARVWALFDGSFAVYQASVASGAESILADVQRTDSACGGTVRFILGGYSQGAWVVHDALHQMTRTELSQVAGVALFGDSDFVPLQSIVRDNKLEDLFAGVSAIVDPRNTGVPAAVSAHTGSWCYTDDPVCQASPANIANELPGCALGLSSCPHFQYVSGGETAKAATFLTPFLPKATLWPHLTSASPPGGTVGIRYRWKAAAAPAGTYEWAAAGGLPPGLSFSQAGVLSGVPTQAGTFTFQVTATAKYQRSASGSETVTISPAGSVSTTWTAAAPALPAGAGPGTNSQLESAACSSTTCSAVGTYIDSSGVTQGLLLSGSGASWTAAQAPVPATDYRGVFLDAVACPSTCVAAGSYADSADFGHGLLVSGSAAGWTASQAPLPANAAGDNANLTAVACASASACVVVGSYQNSSGQQEGVLIAGAGSSWVATQAPLPANAAASSSVDLESAACASGTECVAVGLYFDSSGQEQGLILTGAGSSWTATEAPLPANAISGDADAVDGLDSVTCPAASDCVTVGAYTDASGNSQPLILSGTGSSWTPVEGPLPGGATGNGGVTAANLDAVSCSSSANCVASGEYDQDRALILTGSGTSWSATDAALPPNNFVGESRLVSAACQSAGQCFAVGHYWDAATTQQGLTASGNGSTWTAAEGPLPPAASATDAADLVSISCLPAATCVALGNYSETSGTYGFLVIGHD